MSQAPPNIHEIVDLSLAGRPVPLFASTSFGPIPLVAASGLHVALRAKQSQSAAHSVRVAMYATAWGFAYGMRDDHVHLFEMTGLLHEIGKIGIPDRVLQKPDGLSENERAIMDLQPQVGIEILKAAGASKNLLCAMGSVGKDYASLSNPNSTESWSMAARLIRVIDAYDSMTARSVYRDPKTREDAVNELIRNVGTQFDPKLARSFAQLVIKPIANIEEQVQARWEEMLPIAARGMKFHLEFELMDASMKALPMLNMMNDSFYRHMLNNIHQGVIFVDCDFRILQWNKAAALMTGKTAESVMHRYWKPSLVGFRDRNNYPLQDHLCPFLSMIISGERSQQKLKLKRSEDIVIDVRVEVVPFTNDRGKLTGGAIILDDISEENVLEQTIIQLNEQATQDQLTKVANRGELNRQLPDFIKQHAKGDPFGAIIICDIDYFKRINDHFSHQAGDEALKAFANILRESCRSTDLVARYGGEEFVMLCSQCDLNEAKELAESIRRKLTRTPIPALHGACIKASFGVTVVHCDDNEKTALGRADRGLLTAKENGRDQVVAITGDNELNLSRPAPPDTWDEWLDLSSKKVKLDAEYVTNVPRSLVYEKLCGFAEELQALILQVQDDFAVFEVDCRNFEIPREPTERLGKHLIHIGMKDIELRAGNDKVRQATHLRVVIAPATSRDRREDASFSQCNWLKSTLQRYLLAVPFDENLRADFVRFVKPVSDSRYQ